MLRPLFYYRIAENSNTTTELTEELSTTQVQQFTFDNQRTVKSEDSYILPPISNISSQTACNMPAAKLTSEDILKHPVLVDTLTWDDTQFSGTEIGSFTIPAIFANLDTFHTRMLQVYAFFKPKVCLRFLVNSTKFHQGKLIAFYDPMETTVPAGTLLKKRVRNRYMATGQPNVILDAGYSNSGIIEIPFEHVLSYMTTNSQERAPQMGTIYLMVLNQLGASTGVTPSLQVQVMLSCEEVQLHIPMMPHTIQLLSEPPLVPQSIPTPVNTTNDTSRLLERVPAMKKPSSGVRQLMDATLSTWKTLPTAFWNLFTGNWNGLGENVNTLWENAKDNMEGGLKMFGMDKPSLLDNKTQNFLSTAAPLPHMKGVDGSIRLAATPTGGYTKMDFSAANEGEMSIKEIIKTKMMIAQVPWSTTNAAYTPLYATSVHPGACNSSISSVTGYTQLNPTFLSYMSLAYEQWHGSINFRFDFAATQFHTGRIIAVFEPNSATIGFTDDLIHATNNPSYLFDLHENKTFEINIPFVSSTPRKNTVNPLSAALSEDDETTLGTLILYVYTPLAITNNVLSDITFNVYVSAGDDFVFEIPRIRDDVYFPSDTEIPVIAPPEDVMFPQSVEALPLRSEDRSSPPSIIKGSGVTVLACHYNEEIADVRDFARRYANYTPMSLTFAGEPSSTLFYTTANNETSLISITRKSAQIPLTFISSLFTFWSGSIRYKYIPHVNRTQSLRASICNAIGKTAGAPMLGTAANSFLQGAGKSYPYHIQNCAQDSGLEVEIPFYSFYNQFLVNQVQSTGNFNDLIYGSGSVITQFETDATADFADNTLNVTALVSAGDDFQLRFLVSPPLILIATPT